MFMTQKRETEWRSLRLAFMVCSIIGASAIVPTIGALGIAGLIFRREVLPWAFETWPTSVAIMITAFVTFVLTIVSCSYSLCCAPKPEKEQSPTNINVANVIPGPVPGYQFPMGYQHNPYQQGQMPVQFTEAGQVPGYAPAASG
ncbi:protein shisa-5-like [Mytilus edulis]|uniref:protein shisa-5-like n=1 Tax=Mytilus edulis TaxID=6550 RepID=UPI0039F09A22